MILRLLVDACLTPEIIPRLSKRRPRVVDPIHVDALLPPATDTRERQIEAAIVIVEAVLAWMASGLSPAGHVFTWRKSQGGRLAVRRLP